MKLRFTYNPTYDLILIGTRLNDDDIIMKYTGSKWIIRYNIIFYNLSDIEDYHHKHNRIYLKHLNSCLLRN